jgi:hypothetical protein
MSSRSDVVRHQQRLQHRGAHPPDLQCRGLLRAEPGPDDVPEPPEAARRAGDVLQSEAGVDENQAGVGVEQEDMGRQRRDSGHAHGSAVEVMDFHRDSSPSPEQEDSCE